MQWTSIPSRGKGARVIIKSHIEPVETVTLDATGEITCCRANSPKKLKMFYAWGE